jgi:single-strand DNA-binding protein
MADMNKWIGIGRLTRDATLTYTSGGMAICKFAIAVNARVKQGESWADEASFFDVTVFGKAAEAINQYLVKGKQVAVDGRLKQDRWEKDGQNHSRVVINADNVQLLGGGNQQAAPANQASQPQAQAPEVQPGDFPDDIPF